MSGSSTERQVVATTIVIAIATLVFLTILIDRAGIETLRGVITGLVLVSLSAWTIHRLESRRPPGLGRIYLGGLALKIVGMALRIFMLDVVYRGSGDARRYVTYGTLFMEHFRSGEFVTTTGMAGSDETEKIAMLVGGLFTLTGSSFLAASIVWTLIAFWGQFLFTRALRIVLPDADHRRYTMLVMLFPTLLYWPSIVGKDALMIGGLGLASYGAASLLGSRSRLIGLLPFLAGCGLLGIVRPHLSLIAIGALAGSSAFGSITRLRSVADLRTSAVRILALATLLVAASFALTKVTTLISSSEDQTLTDLLEATENRTSTGGSEFQAHPVTGPFDLPIATVNVLIRPFPWEAHNAQTLIAAGEGLLLAALIVASRRRLLETARQLRHHPYLVYALAYTLVFIAAFSFISNFGILARQRSQLLPLLFVLLSLPATPRHLSNRLLTSRTPPATSPNSNPKPTVSTADLRSTNPSITNGHP